MVMRPFVFLCEVMLLGNLFCVRGGGLLVDIYLTPTAPEVLGWIKIQELTDAGAPGCESGITCV